MLKGLKAELGDLLSRRIHDLYGVEITVAPEIPPRRELGDLAFPTGLQLARELKKNPRAIAEEIADGLELPAIVRRMKIEGPGFLNLYLDRARVAARLLAEPAEPPATSAKIVVEHTNINPNKAAHIGHLRNAVLGDVLARVLKKLGHQVEVQNYIDDTGVQVADVVVGFADMRHQGHDEVAAIPEPFDYHCWDLYSRVRVWYEEDDSRRALRTETLHALEKNEGERARLGRLVARRIVSRHLATMRRLGIGYDLLTHESSILGLDFFAQAFEALRDSGAVVLEESGKNAGCWVMPLAESEEFAGLEDPDKVIVRSDGSITYVGKDIAYQLWKFGLLGRDFRYAWWPEEELWESTAEEVGDDAGDGPPAFGGAERVINVIDARQSYLQKIVRAGLERLGHHEAADRSTHFAYEMVSLSAAAAAQLGVETEDGKGLEMSGRKGIGVKADDLLDQLEAKSSEEIGERQPDLEAGERRELARLIAIAALRYFMVRQTTTRVIAFDFDEALSFSGDSGPYLLYSLVRVGMIRRKLAEAGLADDVTPSEVEGLPEETWADEVLWDLVYSAAQVPELVESAGATLELSLLARAAFDLAQKFSTFYNQHPMLKEENDELRAARLAATRVFAGSLEGLLDLLGITVPERM